MNLGTAHFRLLLSRCIGDNDAVEKTMDRLCIGPNEVKLVDRIDGMQPGQSTCTVDVDVNIFKMTDVLGRLHAWRGTGGHLVDFIALPATEDRPKFEAAVDLLARRLFTVSHKGPTDAQRGHAGDLVKAIIDALDEALDIH